MRIYITDLESYNNGHLIGRWVTLPLGEDTLCEINEDILYEGRKACKHTQHHEETFITDYDAEIAISEHDDIYRLNKLAEAMKNFTEDERLKLRLLSCEGYNEREVIDSGLETYEVDIYDYRDNTSFTDTFELLAQDFVDEGVFGEVPKLLENYIDYELIARDLRIDYTEFEPNVIGRAA